MKRTSGYVWGRNKSISPQGEDQASSAAVVENTGNQRKIRDFFAFDLVIGKNASPDSFEILNTWTCSLADVPSDLKFSLETTERDVLRVTYTEGAENRKRSRVEREILTDKLKEIGTLKLSPEAMAILKLLKSDESSVLQAVKIFTESSFEVLYRQVQLDKVKGLLSGCKKIQGKVEYDSALKLIGVRIS